MAGRYPNARVLVTAIAESESGSGSKSASESEREAEVSTTEAEQIAEEIREELNAEPVVKAGGAAREYVREFAPILDCVVCLAGEAADLAALTDVNPSLPLVVYGEATPPSAGDSVVRRDGGTDALVARVADRIERNRERNRLHEANTKLTALNTYTREITACETREAVVDGVVGAVTEALAYDRCVLGLVEGNVIVPYGNRRPDEEWPTLATDEGIAGLTLQTGESQVVDDYASHPENRCDNPNVTSVASVPVDGHGVLQVTTPEPAAFDESDVEFLEIVAAHATEALARLERETALRTERDRLHAFFEGLPAPTVYVESERGAPPVLREANTAYEAAFPSTPIGKPVDEAFPTEIERRLFGESIRSDDPITTTVRRDTIDAADSKLRLTLVPVRTAGVAAAGFGVYVRDVTLP